MKRTTAFASATVIALVLALAAPAGAGGANLVADPSSGPVGTTVTLTLHCGYDAPDFEVYFVDSPETAFALIYEEPSAGPMPVEFQVTVPAVLDQGPAAPMDVEPGTYQIVVEC